MSKLYLEQDLLDSHAGMFFSAIFSLCERWVYLLLILSLFSKGSGEWVPNH